jgi:hypothetical protein
LDDISAVGVKIGEVEVAMGIDQHSMGILRQKIRTRRLLSKEQFLFPPRKRKVETFHESQVLLRGRSRPWGHTNGKRD